MSAPILSPEAVRDLENIWDFVASDNEGAADRLIEKFFEAFGQLAKWPGQGHSRPDLTDRDVRFWPVGSYLVVYQDKTQPLSIVAILHGARDVPEIIRNR